MTKNNKQKNTHANWQFFSIGNILDYEQPVPFIVESTEYKKIGTPVLTAGKTFILGYTDEKKGIYQNLPVIIFDDFTTAIKYVDFPFKVKSSAMKILKNKPGKSNIKFVFGWMQTHEFIVGEHKRNYLSEYQYLDILLPSIEEQNKIVQILEAWDNYLEKLNKKIEIKKQIKKGLMQNLLTGRVRLKGFGDEWEIVRLRDVAKMNSGGTPNSKIDEYYNGDILWVSITDMTKNGKFIFKTERKITEHGLKNSSVKKYPKGTILYAMYASIGECSIAGVELTSSQAILGIQVGSKLYNIFLYYFLNLIKDKIKLQGQQGTQSNLNSEIVKNFILKLPNISEQKNIANILEKSDREIESLEKKKKIIEAQKKFLLNNLISGKIRHPEFINS